MDDLVFKIGLINGTFHILCMMLVMLPWPRIPVRSFIPPLVVANLTCSGYLVYLGSFFGYLLAISFALIAICAFLAYMDTKPGNES